MNIDAGLRYVVSLDADANSIASVAHKKSYINAVNVHYRPEDTHEHDFCGTVKVAFLHVPQLSIIDCVVLMICPSGGIISKLGTIYNTKVSMTRTMGYTRPTTNTMGSLWAALEGLFSSASLLLRPQPWVCQV